MTSPDLSIPENYETEEDETQMKTKQITQG